MDVQMEVVRNARVREPNGSGPVSSRRMRNPDEVLSTALLRIEGSFASLRQRSGAWIGWPGVESA